MTLEEIKQKRKEYGYSYKQMAELSGVPLGTVQKILSGQTKSPRFETLSALGKVFDHADPMPMPPGRGPYPNAVREEEAQYGRAAGAWEWTGQGSYTVEDYERIPDEKRVELIDGVIYDMAAPTVAHQIIAGMIYAELLSCATVHGMACEPLISPVDVQLDCDMYTMVQPDVLILCDLKKLQKGRVYGAPDFVVEILSELTKKKDTGIKYLKYRNAEVREYWIIYPDERKILVYYFENDAVPKIFGENDKVPILISNGLCEVDFSKIFTRIDRVLSGTG